MSEHAMGKVASGERGSPRRIGRSIGAVLAGMVVSPPLVSRCAIVLALPTA